MTILVLLILSLLVSVLDLVMAIPAGNRTILIRAGVSLFVGGLLLLGIFKRARIAWQACRVLPPLGSLVLLVAGVMVFFEAVNRGRPELLIAGACARRSLLNVIVVVRLRWRGRR